MPNQLSSHDFINTRSFLVANVEKILENISSRREAKKIDTDDLFGDNDGKNNSIKNSWINNYANLSKLDILMMEKEILGLYVSGNPLQEYVEIQNWAREVAGYDDIYIVIVEKIKKIFTKSGAMMLGMNITIIPENGKESQIDGVVYSKKTPELSSILEDKKIFWVKGKLQEPKEKVKILDTQSSNPENELETSIETTEQRDFIENTKLIFEESCSLSLGALGLFNNLENSLSNPRREILENISWDKVAINPEALFNKESQKLNEEKNKLINFDSKLVIIRDSLNIQKVKEIKSQLIQTNEGISPQTHFKVILKVVHLGLTKNVNKDYWIEKTYYETIQTLIS